MEVTHDLTSTDWNHLNLLTTARHCSLHHRGNVLLLSRQVAKHSNQEINMGGVIL